MLTWDVECFMDSIAKRFVELTMAHRGEVKAVMTTVIPLPLEEEKELKETLKDIIGCGKKVNRSRAKGMWHIIHDFSFLALVHLMLNKKEFLFFFFFSFFFMYVRLIRVFLVPWWLNSIGQNVYLDMSIKTKVRSQMEILQHSAHSAMLLLQVLKPRQKLQVVYPPTTCQKHHEDLQYAFASTCLLFALDDLYGGAPE